MRPAHDATVHLRLPASLRRELDGAARASGSGLSSVARHALALGLKALSGSNDDKLPPPSAPSGVMPVAA